MKKKAFFMALLQFVFIILGLVVGLAVFCGIGYVLLKFLKLVSIICSVEYLSIDNIMLGFGIAFLIGLAIWVVYMLYLENLNSFMEKSEEEIVDDVVVCIDEISELINKGD